MKDVAPVQLCAAITKSVGFEFDRESQAAALLSGARKLDRGITAYCLGSDTNSLHYLRAMRTLLALCLIFGLIGFSAPALPDQTDPRLINLFARLKAASGPIEAAPAEQQIWAIWLQSPDKTVTTLMEEGIDGMNGGDYKAALQAFDKIVEIAPKFAEGWNKRATVHYLMENFRESLADIVKTLELEPRHFGALSGRGLVYAKLDKLERAFSAFEAAVAVHPHMTGARINLEVIRQILKRREI